VNHQDGRYTRLRYTATGALAALAAVGAVAGTVALAASPAANPPAKPHGHAAVASGGITKTPSPPTPGKTRAPQPGSDQPFLNDVQQLVNAGTISAAEGQVLDGEIQAGQVDTQTLASSGFTPAQLQAVQQALSGTKRAMAAAVPRTSK
jgi:hypothetical protein